MVRGKLRIIRIVLSVAILILISAAFLELSGSAWHHRIHPLLHLQFIPSLLTFIGMFGVAGLGFLVILVLTLFFGRIYCSSLCPLGTLMDIVIYIRRKIKRPRFRFHKARNKLRYLILAGILLSLVTGGLWLIDVLDPFSIFGKIINALGRPVFTMTNNLTVTVLNWFGVYSIYHTDQRFIILPALFFATLMLLIIVVLSVFAGRLYCNTICPVGSLLGLLSRVSFFRVRISKSKCNTCGICGSKCKAECIDMKIHEVDTGRCIGCFDCLNVCKSDAISYRFGFPRAVSFHANPGKDQPSFSLITTTGGRRQFVATTTGLILMLTGAGDLAGMAKGVQKRNRSSGKALPPFKWTTGLNDSLPVTPPGSLSIKHFTDYCIACHQCVSVCPSNVLIPSFLEYGWAGVLQPRLDFMRSYCNYNCTLCSEVCPSGAILPVTVREKKTIQLGRSILLPGLCVVYIKNQDCGACSERCPTKACHMVPWHGLSGPEIDNTLCIGCGACQHSCPTVPDKAIFVMGHEIHKQALLPKDTGKKKMIDLKEKFPF